MRIILSLNDQNKTSTHRDIHTSNYKSIHTHFFPINQLLEFLFCLCINQDHLLLSKILASCCGIMVVGSYWLILMGW